MSTSNYKLTYFDGRGLAEPIRLIFALSGVAFTDDRLPADDDRKSWLALKPSTPLGKVPILTVDGVHVIAQSKAIERFLAKRFGLFGCSEMEGVAVDAIVEEVRDVVTGWFAVRTDKEKVKIYYENDMRKSFENLNKMATANGYFVGNRLSYADIVFAYMVTTAFDREETTKTMEGLEYLKKIVAQVEGNEKYKSYVAARKVTPW